MSESVLQRVAIGDTAAVEECLQKYGGLVWSLARRLSVSPADAEDAVQEIFLDVWKNAGRFDEAKASESTFIAMLARRRLIDRHRRQSRNVDAIPIEHERTLPPAADEDRAEVDDEVAHIRHHMQRLRPEERQVLELAIYQGLSQSQIAQVMEIPLGTVKTHSRRGLTRLRQWLDVTTDVKGGSA